MNRPFKEFYEDFYGCTASILRRTSGECLLTIRIPQGDIIHSKTYRTYRGAKIALGIYSDGTATLKTRKEC